MTLLSVPQLSLIILLAIAALLALPRYLIAPVRLRSRSRQGTAPALELAESEEEIPEPVSAALGPWTRSLESAGFTALPLCRGAVSSARGGSVWYFRLLQREESGDVARVMTSYDTSGQRRSTALVVFETRLADGGAVRTTNSPLPSTTPTPAGDHSARFAGERDAARLYALHRAHVRRVGRPGRRGAPIGDPVEFQRREEELGQQRMVSSGWYEIDGGSLRPTWRGAFLATWRFLPPWRTLVDARD